VNIIYWILVIVLLVVLAYAGVIRPTGLVGRTREQDDDDCKRLSVARWLKKQDPE
jgi:hypothetical protein